jgi:hypothetical protein
MSYSGQSGQDWTEVVIRKKTPKPTSASQAVSQAKKQGLEVETVKKYNAGSNKKGPVIAA